MGSWLRILLVVLVVWIGFSILISLLRVAVFLGALLALPLALFAGYLYWRRNG